MLLVKQWPIDPVDARPAYPDWLRAGKHARCSCPSSQLVSLEEGPTPLLMRAAVLTVK